MVRVRTASRTSKSRIDTKTRGAAVGGCRSPRTSSVDPTEANPSRASESRRSRPRVPRRIRVAEWLAFAGLVAACVASIGPGRQASNDVLLAAGIVAERDGRPRVVHASPARGPGTGDAFSGRAVPVGVGVLRCGRPCDRPRHLALRGRRRTLRDHALWRRTHVQGRRHDPRARPGQPRSVCPRLCLSHRRSRRQVVAHRRRRGSRAGRRPRLHAGRRRSHVRARPARGARPVGGRDNRSARNPHVDPAGNRLDHGCARERRGARPGRVRPRPAQAMEDSEKRSASVRSRHSSRRRSGRRLAPLMVGALPRLLRRRLDDCAPARVRDFTRISSYYNGLGTNLPNDYWLDWVQHWFTQSFETLLILRIPALLCMAAVWALSRWTLSRVVPIGTSTRGVTEWVLASAFFAGAIAWGMTLRPEPIIAVLVTGALACAVWFSHGGGARPLALFAVLVPLAATGHHAGVVLLAPLVVIAGPVLKWARRELASAVAIVTSGFALLVTLAFTGSDIAQRADDAWRRACTAVLQTCGVTRRLATTISPSRCLRTRSRAGRLH